MSTSLPSPGRERPDGDAQSPERCDRQHRAERPAQRRRARDGRDHSNRHARNALMEKPRDQVGNTLVNIFRSLVIYENYYLNIFIIYLFQVSRARARERIAMSS